MTSGFVYFGDDAGQAEIAADYERFTDAIATHRGVERRQVALVSFSDESIEAAAVMTRAGKAVTRKWRVGFDDFLWLTEPVAIDELETVTIGLSGAAADALRSAVEARGGPISENLWPPVFEALQTVCTDQRDALQTLADRAAQRRPREPSGDRDPIVLYEHDAVGLALELAGVDRRPILEAWQGDEEQPFLQGLSAYLVPEDRAIEHDASIFGGWDVIGRNPAGMAVFEEHGQRVTIINANRAGIEHAVGVDLVYYNHHYDAYVLVQYKRMRPRASGPGAEYRPDAQLDAELARLRAVAAGDSGPNDPLGYRLCSEAAYLKLCAPASAARFSFDLVSGMYLPLAYWDVLCESGALRGQRGGDVASFDNIDRYLTNTDFIALVKSGWLGSRCLQSATVGTAIRDALAADHSLILAVADGNQMTRRYVP